jgi:hypothetical protein
VRPGRAATSNDTRTGEQRYADAARGRVGDEMVMGLRPGAQPAPGDPSKPLLDSPCQGTSAFGSRSTRSAAAEDLACAAAWEAGRSIREEREIRIVDHLRILRGLTKEIRVATH